MCKDMSRDCLTWRERLQSYDPIIMGPYAENLAMQGTKDINGTLTYIKNLQGSHYTFYNPSK